MSVLLIVFSLVILAVSVPSRLSESSKEECDAYNFSKRYGA